MKTIEVVAAIIKKDNLIFAAKRGYGEFKNMWEFPGGKIKDNETKEDALIREIKEELNADIIIKKYLTTIEYQYPEFYLKMHCYLCTLKNDNIELLEHLEFKWLDYNNLDSIKWLPADQMLINTYKKQFN